MLGTVPRHPLSFPKAAWLFSRPPWTGEDTVFRALSAHTVELLSSVPCSIASSGWRGLTIATLGGIHWLSGGTGSRY